MDVVELLIVKYGGDPNAKTMSDESLLHYACQWAISVNKDTPVWRKLIKY